MVTTPTVRMPSFLGGARDDRRGAGAGAAAHAGGDEHHMRAGEMVADLVHHLLGGGAADFRLRAGAEALGHLHAHLDDALGARQRERLRVGIGDDEIDALQARRDHVVDGVAAGAAHAEYGDPRLQFPDVGIFRLIVIVASWVRGRWRAAVWGRSAPGLCELGVLALGHQKLSRSHRPTREK